MTKVGEKQLVIMVVEGDTIPIDVVGSYREVLFICWVLEVDECDFLSVIRVDLAWDKVELDVERLSCQETESDLSETKDLGVVMHLDFCWKIRHVDDLDDAFLDVVDVAVAQIHHLVEEADVGGANLGSASLDQLQSVGKMLIIVLVHQISDHRVFSTFVSHIHERTSKEELERAQLESLCLEYGQVFVKRRNVDDVERLLRVGSEGDLFDMSPLSPACCFCRALSSNLLFIPRIHVFCFCRRIKGRKSVDKRPFDGFEAWRRSDQRFEFRVLGLRRIDLGLVTEKGDLLGSKVGRKRDADVLRSKIAQSEGEGGAEKRIACPKVKRVAAVCDLDDLCNWGSRDCGVHLDSVVRGRSIRKEVEDLNEAAERPKRKSLESGADGLCAEGSDRSCLGWFSSVTIKEEEFVGDRSPFLVGSEFNVSVESVGDGKSRSVDESKVSDQSASHRAAPKIKFLRRVGKLCLAQPADDVDLNLRAIFFLIFWAIRYAP